MNDLKNRVEGRSAGFRVLDKGREAARVILRSDQMIVLVFENG